MDNDLNRTKGLPITAGQLRDWLATFEDPDTPIVLAGGDDCYPLAHASEVLYDPGPDWSGRVLTPSQAADFGTEPVILLEITDGSR